MIDPVAALSATDDQANDEWAGTAEVTDTSAGSTPDGRRLIELRLNGISLTATYASSYTPVVGHRVIYLKKGTSIFVLAAPATV